MSQCVNAPEQIQLACNTLIIMDIFYDNGGQSGDVYVRPNPAQATIYPAWREPWRVRDNLKHRRFIHLGVYKRRFWHTLRRSPTSVSSLSALCIVDHQPNRKRSGDRIYGSLGS